jgi:hypothetical protein
MPMRQSASPAPPIAGRMRVVSRFARSEFQKKPTTAKAQTSCIAMINGAETDRPGSDAEIRRNPREPKANHD